MNPKGECGRARANHKTTEQVIALPPFRAQP